MKLKLVSMLTAAVMAVAFTFGCIHDYDKKPKPPLGSSVIA